MALGHRGVGLVAGVLGLLPVLDAAAAQKTDRRIVQPVQHCAAVNVALPTELANWSSRVPARAAKEKGALGTAVLTIGQAVDATLIPTGAVRYVLHPEKPGKPASYGGLYGFSVKEAGTYRVALGAGAWIDVVKGNKAVASTAHSHGPDCSNVRKIVDFPLTPGRYVLQLGASGTEGLAVMIARLR